MKRRLVRFFANFPCSNLLQFVVSKPILLNMREPLSTTTTESIVERGNAQFPTPPVIISLGDMTAPGKPADASQTIPPAYPALCISACNTLHPAFDPRTLEICYMAKINNSLTLYEWEVAVDGKEESLSSIMSQSWVAGVENFALDSIYFPPGSLVRCRATAVDEDGKLGEEMV